MKVSLIEDGCNTDVFKTKTKSFPQLLNNLGFGRNFTSIHKFGYE